MDSAPPPPPPAAEEGGAGGGKQQASRGVDWEAKCRLLEMENVNLCTERNKAVIKATLSES